MMIKDLKRYITHLIKYHPGQSGLLLAIVCTLLWVPLVIWWGGQWINQPFAGFLHRNHIVSSYNLPGWPAWQVWIQPGDKIVAVDDHAFTAAAWLDYVRQQPPDQPIIYTLQKENGQLIRVHIPVHDFKPRDFTQLILIPIFIAALVLMAAGGLILLRPTSPSVTLLGTYTLVTAHFSISQPDFVTGKLFYWHFFVPLLSRIILPVLLLQLLLNFPAPLQRLKRWDFLLPLIYLPILPLVIFLPVLIDEPGTIVNFEKTLRVYTGTYLAIGCGLLLQRIRIGGSTHRKQAAILLLGFILPISLFVLDALTPLLDFRQNIAPIQETLARYVLWAIPIAIIFAIVRYDIFGTSRISYRRVVYLGAISIMVGVCIVLVTVISPVEVGYSRLDAQDFKVILLAALISLFLLFLRRHFYQWWAGHNLAYSLADLRVNLRILAHELVKIKTRRDLEALVSWNLPADFALQSAEISSSNIASSPYALRLPLGVNNFSLGSLFIGPKIKGEAFTSHEQNIFTEIQKQISLALLSIELDGAIRTTEELTRLKSKFLTNVTHELRTPLNGIINYIGLVLDEPASLNVEQISHLKQALQGAERLLDLINNILDLSKIEAGQMTLLKRPVNLAELATELTPVMSELLRHKPVEFIAEVAPMLPSIEGDRLRIRQIMLNLLSNAAKFTDRGTIRLSIYPENGNVTLRVTDTGRGIDERLLPSIFQGFTTSELTDARQRSGPGLGLPITKSLVTLHQGQIEVISRVGLGTTFMVNLPVNEAIKN